MAFRERRAFSGKTMVSVRCPRCGVRLAECWPHRTALGPGWDGVVMAHQIRSRWDLPPGPDEWQCQRCKAVHTIDAVELYYALAMEQGGSKPEVTLGHLARPTREVSPGPSRDW